MSSHMLWVLAGIALGYKILEHPYRQRYYVFVSPEGEMKYGMSIHRSIVNKLRELGFLCKSSNIQNGTTVERIGLTTDGFDKIADSITKIGGSIYKATVERNTRILIG